MGRRDGIARGSSFNLLGRSDRKTVIEGGSAARYLPSGHIVYARGGIVFAVPFDARPAGSYRSGGGRHRRGQTSCRQGDRRRPVYSLEHRTSVLHSRSGQYRNLGAHNRNGGSGGRGNAIDRSPRARTFTPARPATVTRLAIGSDDGKEAAVWIYRLGETSALQRLTLEGRNRFPIWSPDGARVAFQSDRGGDLAIYVQRVDGTGRAERLTKAGNGESHVPESWSPDGRYILLSVAEGL